MAFEFKFPDVGEGITEGEIVKWRVKEQEEVDEDQILADIETDKAVVEVPSPKKGTILKLLAKEGETIKVGQVIVVIGEKGEDIKTATSKEPEEKKEQYGGVVGEIKSSNRVIEHIPEKEIKPAEQKAFATPGVRKFAKEQGVNVENVNGTGYKGQVTTNDILKYKEEHKEDEEVNKEPKEEQNKEELKFKAKVTRRYDFYGYVDHVPLKGIRKATAKKMKESWDNVPHVVHMDEFDVTELYNLKNKEEKSFKEKGVRLTFLPYIIKALIESLKLHPYLNASIDDANNDIIIKKYYNIGFAADTEEGLVVPVIKGADNKTMLQIADELQKLAELARARKIDLSDLQGGTFTITNIGSIGGLYATPIINYPEVAILGTMRMQDKVAIVNGEAEIRKMMGMCLSFDHRVLDGAEAARFMNDLKKLLENS